MACKCTWLPTSTSNVDSNLYTRSDDYFMLSICVRKPWWKREIKTITAGSNYPMLTLIPSIVQDFLLNTALIISVNLWLPFVNYMYMYSMFYKEPYTCTCSYYDMCWADPTKFFHTQRVLSRKL